MLVHLIQTQQVVISGTFHRSIKVFANIDTQNPVITGLDDLLYQMINALVVKAKAVDYRLRLRQAEQARFWVARLRARGNGANFDKAKTGGGQPKDCIAVFIQSGSQPDRVGKIQTHHRYRQTGRLLAQLLAKPAAAGITKQLDGKIVGSLGVELEHQGASKSVHGNQHTKFKFIKAAL